MGRLGICFETCVHRNLLERQLRSVTKGFINLFALLREAEFCTGRCLTVDQTPSAFCTSATAAKKRCWWRAEFWSVDVMCFCMLLVEFTSFRPPLLNFLPECEDARSDPGNVWVFFFFVYIASLKVDVNETCFFVYFRAACSESWV